MVITSSQICWIAVWGVRRPVWMSFIWKTNVGKAGTSCNENLYQQHSKAGDGTITNNGTSAVTFYWIQWRVLLQGINLSKFPGSLFGWFGVGQPSSQASNVFLHKFFLLGFHNILLAVWASDSADSADSAWQLATRCYDGGRRKLGGGGWEVVWRSETNKPEQLPIILLINHKTIREIPNQ